MPTTNIDIHAYKTLGSGDHTITPFEAYAPQTASYTSGSANTDYLQVYLAQQYVSNGNLRVANATYDIFDSVIQTFYSGLPASQYGIHSSSYFPSESIYVLSVPYQNVGEQIKPGSFTASIGTSYLYDDSRGNLITSQSGTGYIIGNIFYEKGIAVTKRVKYTTGAGEINQNGLYIINGTTLNVNYYSVVTFYENTIHARVYPNEFNFSLYNPSVTQPVYTGSSSTPLQLITSHSIMPYVTSIGLYNSSNDLIAVAKLSSPIKRTSDSIQTFIIKFDT
jgi:hypothetical protein